VWASGTGGIIIRTVDGGANWKLITAPDATNDFYAVDAVDSSTAWVVGTAGGVTATGAVKIWKTTNGGSTWTVQFQHADSYGDALKFFDANNGIFLGDPSQANKSRMVIATTSNGGTTWTQGLAASIPPVDSAADEVSTVNALEFVGNNAYFVTYGNSTSIDPKVFKSTDKGLTWTASPRVKLNNSTGITMKDDKVGMICNFNGKVAKTADGWATADSSGPFGEVYGLRSVKWFAGTNVIYLVGGPSSTGFCGKSVNGGATWTQVLLPSGVARLRYMQFINTTTGWTIGNSGSIAKWSGGDATIPDSVNVTFWVNTSTVPDTMKPTSFVQIRGDAPLFGPWGVGSKAILTNVAGDYWKGTYKLQVGDAIPYKFFTNANKVLPADANDKGWEGDLVEGNRMLIVGPKDTTVPLQFVNGSPIKQTQYWTPYVNQKDSIEVWFRVNMIGNAFFSKNSQFIGVRGGTPPLDWGKSIVLTKESQHGNGGSQQYDGTNFWSGYGRFPKSAFASAISYKYVILDANKADANVSAWEENIKPASDVGGDGNRAILTSPGVSDTTIAWKWWANSPFVPFTGADTVIVTFRANLQRAIAERGFSFGDTIQVRSGYGGTGLVDGKTKAMVRSGLTGTLFTATDTVVASVGKLLHYQYYMVKGGQEPREIFYDFDWTGDVAQSERRKVSIASKSLTVNDTTSTSFDMRRMPRFANTSKLTKPVNVTYTVDVRPAIYTVKAGKKLVSTNITPYVIGNVDSIKIWGVWMNGPAVGGWDIRGGWGPARRLDSLSKMYDDGTHGDVVKGDSVYSLKWRYTTSDVVGQTFKFGIGALDNEGGFGNNHIENVSDADTVFTVASQFGSIDPKFFNSWDFDLKKPKVATAVEDNWSVPMMYELSQNYPNPFNPSTAIQFTIPTQDVVTLKVFNVLGQEMMTILNQKMDAGKHTVRFDASKLTSGVYLYQVSAGKFVETKKMVLLK
jgi:hypothetical protein